MALTRNDTLSQMSSGWLRSRYLVRDLVGQLAIFLVVALLMLGYVFYQWYQAMSAEDLNYLWWYWKAYFWGVVLVLPEHLIVFHSSDDTLRWQAQEVLNNARLVDFVNIHYAQLQEQIKQALPWGIGAWLMLASVFFWGGKRQRDNELLEGVQQIPLKVYHRFLKKQKLKSAFRIGNAHWTQNAEVQHLLVTGDPGTGKSQLLTQLLQQIRAAGDMAIVYDPKGDMVRDFYQPESDVLYSPFDQRSSKWEVWQDLNTEQALETFAEAVIKESPGKDNFWAKTARMVLVAALKQGRKENLSFVQTIQKLVNSDLDALAEWLQDSEVASDFSNPKTAATILSELKSQARALKYLAESDSGSEQTSFSIELFFAECFEKLDAANKCTNKAPMPWLFLPVNERFKASATPIMAAQIELIANFILSQESSRKRRIWLVIDELPSLPKLPALMRLLAQGRGYGVAGVLAIQNLSQLFEVYGRDQAYSLTGLCSSLVAMRTSDTQSADYLSKRFGKMIRKEVQTNQSLSKGKAGSFSQGHSEHIAERAAVSETQLHSLPDLKAFFKANGVPNPVQIDIAINRIEPRNPPHCLIKETPLGESVAPEPDAPSTEGSNHDEANDSAHDEHTASQNEADSQRPNVTTWDI